MDSRLLLFLFKVFTYQKEPTGKKSSNLVVLAPFFPRGVSKASSERARQHHQRALQRALQGADGERSSCARRA